MAPWQIILKGLIWRDIVFFSFVSNNIKMYDIILTSIKFFVILLPTDSQNVLFLILPSFAEVLLH